MARDTRFDLGFAAFQAALVVAIVASPAIKYIEEIMLCLAVSIPSAFAMWFYRVPCTTTEKTLCRMARLLSHVGSLFAFSFLIGSYSYRAALVFLGVWLFWLLSIKFPKGSDLP
jgi:hypothetical protein